MDTDTLFRPLEKLLGEDPKRVASVIGAWQALDPYAEREERIEQLADLLEAQGLGRGLPIGKLAATIERIPPRELWRRSRPPEPLPKGGVALPSGAWRGYFQYFSETARHPTSAALTFGPHGEIAGEGEDEDGPFAIEGRYDASRGTCSWTKTYPLACTKVSYTGRWSPGRGALWGGWTIDGDTWGQFELRPGERPAEVDPASLPLGQVADLLHEAIGEFKALQTRYADLGASDTEPDTEYEIALKRAWRGEDCGSDWMLYAPEDGVDGDRFDEAVASLDAAAAKAKALLLAHPGSAALRTVLEGYLWRIDLDSDDDVSIDEIGAFFGPSDEIEA